MTDEKATRDKVNELLSKYHNIRRLAGQPIFSSLESAINSECYNPENKHQVLLLDIHNALSMMPDKESNLLFKVYMTDLTISITELSNFMNISRDTFYRRKNKAMIYFSESFRGGTLIVLKDLSSNKEFVVKVLGDKYD